MLGVLLVASVAVAVAGSSPVAGASTPTQRMAALTAALQRVVAADGGPPGAIALVQRGSRLLVSTAGVGDVATGTPIGADDTIRIASVSKAFSGAVALQLVSQKRLKLSDTIGELLPALPAAWHPVTLGQLLNHTSGLPDYIKSKAFIAVLTKNPLIDLTPNQLLDFVAHKDLSPGHGHVYDYSDSDNLVVGLMVEAVTGGTYESALASEVTTPLGIGQTVLPTDVAMPSPYVHGYSITPGKPPEDVTLSLNPALAWASGGMLSTPAELNTFMRAYVQGAFTTAPTRRAQFRFIPGDSGPPGPGTNASGLAIFRYRTSCGTVYGHTGNFPGYTIFAAATRTGRRSAEVVVNEQLNDRTEGPVFTLLRQADLLAVCAALPS
jgi:D-alanyl-D-alanine carboxypeptidase